MDSGLIHDGLDGVQVAETELSHVDGERGWLVLRGYDVERLAPTATFEDAAHLFWEGRLPDAAERGAMQARLYRGRARAFERLAELGAALSAADAMEALRGATAQLVEADLDDLPALLCGALPVFTAAHARLRAGLDPIAPRAELSHSADYLAMLSGQTPLPALARALDSYLVTVCDHGMNASTFTARVIASTGSDSVSAVVGALGALKGPLHGGAPGAVLDMLDAIGSAEHASAWIGAALDRGERIMGMGHRIYRVRDPRAAVLEAATRTLCATAGVSDRLALARAVEDAAALQLDARHSGRKLRANVEFNTAVLLDAVGLDRRLFTATFAIARVVGWLAHIAEQRKRGRLIRPASRYIGPLPATSSTPGAARSQAAAR
jgi:citrate synthase